MGLRLKTLWSVGYEAYLTYSELYLKKLLETGVFIYKKYIFTLKLDTLLIATDAIISLIGYISITFYLRDDAYEFIGENSHNCHLNSRYSQF